MIDGRRKKQIKRTAEDVLKQCQMNIPAFRIDDLLKQLSVRLVEAPELSESILGFSFVKDNEKFIGVKSTDTHMGRRRFTIAHELGHLMLHQNSMLNYGHGEVYFRHTYGHQKHDPKEYEANYFAACLLMPEDLVQNYVNSMYPQFGLMGDDIDTLAAKFQVSSSAMTIRLSELGYTLF